MENKKNSMPSDVPRNKENKKIEKLNLEINNLKLELNNIKIASAKIINEYNSNSNYLQEQYRNDYKYRSQTLLEDIVKNLDIFEIALKDSENINEEFKNWLIGFEMVYLGIMKILENEGLNLIKTDIGDIFNSEIHQVIEQKIDLNKKDKEIIEIKRKGYKLHDRLIRPTDVIINQIPVKEIKKKEIKKKENKEKK